MASLGKKNEAAFERSLLKEAERLWLALSFEDQRPDFSFANFCAEMKKRFNAQTLLTRTSNFKGKVLIMGHLVDQQTRKIEQYGFESEFSYLVYDMMVSNGYISWFFDGEFLIGGWATATEMTSVRKASTIASYQFWWNANDGVERKKAEQHIADHLQAEELAIGKDMSARLKAASRRMQLKAAKATVDRLKDGGLEGHNLAIAFIDRCDQFHLSNAVFGHEGRHAIDQKFFADDFKHWSHAEREFRAKLSGITFSSDPYLALANILSRSVDKTGHGKANLKIRKVLLKWMEEHLHEIDDIDADRPLLVQAHLLTTDQIKRCFTAADPLAGN
jgi:hypothetical protein